MLLRLAENFNKIMFCGKILKTELLDRVKIQQKGTDVIWMTENEIESTIRHVLKLIVEYPTTVEYSPHKQRIIGVIFNAKH